MDLEKETEEVKARIQNLIRELQMLDQVRNEKMQQLLKAQGSLELLEKLIKEEK